MSNYETWDLYSLIDRWMEWVERKRTAPLEQQRRSYRGEIMVLEREINKRFFTGPYFPPGFVPPSRVGRL